MSDIVKNAEAWSASAQGYAKLEAKLEAKSISSACTARMLDQMDKIRPFTKATAVVDVGSGMGDTIATVIEKFGSEIPATARLMASDFSSGMIRQLEERQNREQHKDRAWMRLETCVADANSLESISDSSISHFTATMVFNMVDGPKAMKAAHRVLQAGGIIGLTTWHEVEWMVLMGEAAKKIRGEAAKSFVMPPDFSSVEAVREQFETKGISPATVEEVETFMDVTDPNPFINTMVRGNNPGGQMIIGGYSEEEIEAFIVEWERLVKERHPEEPRKLRGVQIVAVGKKPGGVELS